METFEECLLKYRRTLRQLLYTHGVLSNPGVTDDWVLDEISKLVSSRRETLDKLNKVTHIVEHNPNCPSPFLVRLVGPESGVIDKKYYDETKDILGFGKTLEEAARAAFVKESQYALCTKVARKFGWSMGVTWQKINKVKEALAVPTIEDAIEFLSASYVTRDNRFVAD